MTALKAKLKAAQAAASTALASPRAMSSVDPEADTLVQRVRGLEAQIATLQAKATQRNAVIEEALVHERAATAGTANVQAMTVEESEIAPGAASKVRDFLVTPLL